MTKYNQFGSLEIFFHCQNPIFGLIRAFFGGPKADIHSPNIPMVMYHVFGVRLTLWTNSYPTNGNQSHPVAFRHIRHTRIVDVAFLLLCICIFRPMQGLKWLGDALSHKYGLY